MNDSADEDYLEALERAVCDAYEGGELAWRVKHFFTLHRAKMAEKRRHEND